MTLLGLLFLLWEHARLNRWHATAEAYRTENHISAFLGKAVEEMHIARTTLSDQMLCLVTSPNEGQRKYAWSRFFKQRDAKRALVLVGQLGAIGSLAQRWTAALVPYNFRTELPAEVVARAERSYRRVLGAPGRHVFIAVIRPQAYKTIVEYIAVMQTSEAWIPVDSSYELQFARTAVTAKRRFYKPLRLDGADRLPDFVLTDTNPHIECEVFGRDDDDYIMRAQEKKAANPGLWFWDAVLQDVMPDLPAASA